MCEVCKGELFAFAGLWGEWKNPQGQIVESCTILTTTPNALLADIHDRMPVIVTPDKYVPVARSRGRRLRGRPLDSQIL